MIIIPMTMIIMILGLSGRRRRVFLPLSVGDRDHESSRGGGLVEC